MAAASMVAASMAAAIRKRPGLGAKIRQTIDREELHGVFVWMKSCTLVNFQASFSNVSAGSGIEKCPTNIFYLYLPIYI